MSNARERALMVAHSRSGYCALSSRNALETALRHSLYNESLFWCEQLISSGCVEVLLATLCRFALTELGLDGFTVWKPIRALYRLLTDNVAVPSAAAKHGGGGTEADARAARITEERAKFNIAHPRFPIFEQELVTIVWIVCTTPHTRLLCDVQRAADAFVTFELLFDIPESTSAASEIRSKFQLASSTFSSAVKYWMSVFGPIRTAPLTTPSSSPALAIMPWPEACRALFPAETPTADHNDDTTDEPDDDDKEDILLTSVRALEGSEIKWVAIGLLYERVLLLPSPPPPGSDSKHPPTKRKGGGVRAANRAGSSAAAQNSGIAATDSTHPAANMWASLLHVIQNSPRTSPSSLDEDDGRRRMTLIACVRSLRDEYLHDRPRLTPSRATHGVGREYWVMALMLTARFYAFDLRSSILKRNTTTTTTTTITTTNANTPASPPNVLELYRTKTWGRTIDLHKDKVLTDVWDFLQKCDATATTEDGKMRVEDIDLVGSKSDAEGRKLSEQIRMSRRFPIPSSALDHRSETAHTATTNNTIMYAKYLLRLLPATELARSHFPGRKRIDTSSPAYTWTHLVNPAVARYDDDQPTSRPTDEKTTAASSKLVASEYFAAAQSLSTDARSPFCGLDDFERAAHQWSTLLRPQWVALTATPAPVTLIAFSQRRKTTAVHRDILTPATVPATTTPAPAATAAKKSRKRKAPSTALVPPPPAAKRPVAKIVVTPIPPPPRPLPDSKHDDADENDEVNGDEWRRASASVAALPRPVPRRPAVMWTRPFKPMNAPSKTVEESVAPEVKLLGEYWAAQDATIEQLAALLSVDVTVVDRASMPGASSSSRYWHRRVDAGVEEWVQNPVSLRAPDLASQIILASAWTTIAPNLVVPISAILVCVDDDDKQNGSSCLWMVQRTSTPSSDQTTEWRSAAHGPRGECSLESKRASLSVNEVAQLVAGCVLRTCCFPYPLTCALSTMYVSANDDGMKHDLWSGAKARPVTWDAVALLVRTYVSDLGKDDARAMEALETHVPLHGFHGRHLSANLVLLIRDLSRGSDDGQKRLANGLCNIWLRVMIEPSDAPRIDAIQTIWMQPETVSAIDRLFTAYPAIAALYEPTTAPLPLS